MSILSKLPKLIDKKKRRVGRGYGSGRGAKSGRGTTRHQVAREDIPLHFEGGQAKQTKKYPLIRGKGKNKSIQIKPLLVKLDDLNTFKVGEVVTVETLMKNKIVDKKALSRGVKILGGGKLEKKLTIKVDISSTAQKAVEKLGGKVENS